MNISNGISKRTLGKTGLVVSELGLGTTVIGYKYGIIDRPIPSEQEAIALLKHAVELGINFIDTASLYGVAEERIGKSGILKNEKIILATKCGSILEKNENLPPQELLKLINEEVDSSLRKLKIDSIPLLQLHVVTKKILDDGGVPELLFNFKKSGKARFIGACVRYEENAKAAIESGIFDTVQLAYSILDQRMSPKLLDMAKEKDLGIIARSVLLKGIMTDKFETSAFGPLGSKASKSESERLINTFHEIEKIARELGTDTVSLALRFAISNKNIGTALIGTGSQSHLEKAVKAAEAGALPDHIILDLESLAIQDENLIDPQNWPK